MSAARGGIAHDGNAAHRRGCGAVCDIGIAQDGGQIADLHTGAAISNILHRRQGAAQVHSGAVIDVVDRDRHRAHHLLGILRRRAARFARCAVAITVATLAPVVGGDRQGIGAKPIGVARVFELGKQRVQVGLRAKQGHGSRSKARDRHTSGGPVGRNTSERQLALAHTQHHLQLAVALIAIGVGNGNTGDGLGGILVHREGCRHGVDWCVVLLHITKIRRSRATLAERGQRDRAQRAAVGIKAWLQGVGIAHHDGARHVRRGDGVVAHGQRAEVVLAAAVGDGGQRLARERAAGCRQRHGDAAQQHLAHVHSTVRGIGVVPQRAGDGAEAGGVLGDVVVDAAGAGPLVGIHAGHRCPGHGGIGGGRSRRAVIDCHAVCDGDAFADGQRVNAVAWRAARAVVGDANVGACGAGCRGNNRARRKHIGQCNIVRNCIAVVGDGEGVSDRGIVVDRRICIGVTDVGDCLVDGQFGLDHGQNDVTGSGWHTPRCQYVIDRQRRGLLVASNVGDPGIKFDDDVFSIGIAVCVVEIAEVKAATAIKGNGGGWVDQQWITARRGCSIHD